MRTPAEVRRRNQAVVASMVFVVYTGFAFVLPFLPLYVSQLGVEDEAGAARWAGLLIGVAPLLAGLLAPAWGRLADRHGQKPVVLSALGAYVVLLALSAAVRTPLELFLLRAGTGLCGGIGPLGLAMATAGAPRSETGKAVGMVQAAQILSAAVGPLAGGALADVMGIRRTFLLTSALCAAALLLVAGLYQTPGGVREAGPVRCSFASVLAIAGVPALLVILFFVNFVGRSFTPILPLQLGEIGVPPGRLATSTGALISAYSVAAALSAALLGRASRERSPRKLLAGTLAAGAAVVLPMASVPSFGAFVGLAVLLGLFSGGCLTLSYTLGGLMVPEPQRATAYGFLSGAALFGGAVSPSVAGWLASWDFRAIYPLDAGLFLLMAVALLGARWEDAAPAGAPP